MLTDKKGRAFERLGFSTTIPAVDTGSVDLLNEVILKHNQACNDFQTRLTEARQRLETDSVAGTLDEFVELKEAVRASTDLVKRVDAEVRRLNEEIARLEREIVEYRQPAEELNEDLCRYLGHDELCLEIEETGYTIMRNRHPAQTLSKVEMTAIALLYFLKSLQDRRFDLDNPGLEALMPTRCTLRSASSASAPSTLPSYSF